MTQQDQTQARTSTSDDWYQSVMSRMQGWRVQTVKRKRGGLIPRGADANIWTPWAFHFVCQGSLAWMALVAVPSQYSHDLTWCLLTELFTGYVYTHVMINWLFICFTTNTYDPANTTFTSDPTTTTSKSDPIKETTSTSASTESTIMTPNGANASKSDDVTSRNEGGVVSNGGSRMMMATVVGNNKVERRSLPYWSWTKCVVCHWKRPPRCHHCALCGKCVLKRDHHCYFTRNCVGLNNQRYFIYFLFWCVIFTSLGCYQLLPYIYRHVCIQYSYIDLIVPINIFRAIFGNFSLLYCHLVIIMWGGLFLTFLSIVIFAYSVHLVLLALTKFEYESGIKVVDTRSIPDRIRSVMGRNWAVGLLIPGGASFPFVTSLIPEKLRQSPPVEDPINWGYIKI